MLKIGLSVVLVLASTWVALAQSGIEECIYKQGSKQAIVGARRVLQPDEVDTGHRICMGARFICSPLLRLQLRLQSHREVL